MSIGRLEQIRDVSGTVSRETLNKLELFEAEFRRWSTRINLAAPSTLESLWERHILDSAQLAALKPQALRWLDLGSGGGFPGAVMAILLAERDCAIIDLVESNNKKAAFLRTILGSLNAPATVHICRIEDATGRMDTPEIVTARALAPLSRLLELAAPWLEAGAVGLFHKGRDYAAEIAESRDAWRFDLVEHRSKIDPASRVLEISGLARRQAEANANESAR
ncbi:16S rRNA (guanine(527)-N(7))-methyltransferase RsmG [Neoaquamicrobium microcysteis]|uniref:16S rRNA (guanine(527)-N(7))-methyltransferase RsmG n=1 Tax=Neoaquamicrobium microcysteis TaxID=2682781 RepID=UPI0038B262BC